MTQALEAADYAPRKEVALKDLTGIPEEQFACLERSSKDGKLELFTLPGGNICAPLLESSVSAVQFTHVMNGKVGEYQGLKLQSV